MADDFDREKIIDCMFDPVTSSLLAELETSEKSCSYLAKTCSISENEVFEKLSYLLEHGFIFQDYQSKFGQVEVIDEKIMIKIKLSQKPSM